MEPQIIATIKEKLREYTYHPIPFEEFQEIKWSRESRDRFQMIRETLPSDLTGMRVLDVGCNLGYFCFEFAKRGAIVKGIDQSERELNIAKTIATLYNVPVQFECLTVTPQTIQRLIANHNQYNIILFLSVYHHIVRKKGLAYARHILDGFSHLCQTMFFETSHFLFSNLAPTDTPDFVTTEICEHTQFTTVRLLGKSTDHFQRYLFRCDVC